MTSSRPLDDTGAILTAIAERMRPNPARPRLSPEIEENLAEMHARHAAAYAELELAAHRFHKIARALREEERVEEGPPPDDDSLVVNLSELRERSRVDSELDVTRPEGITPPDPPPRGGKGQR